jgi:hypothetical protein
MLQSKYKLNDVLTIKLVSGEEVIGYYAKEEFGTITLRKPVVPVPTSEGSMALAPYIMSSDYLRESGGEVLFNTQCVITIIATSKSFADAYVKQVSGLDLSSKTGSGLIR